MTRGSREFPVMGAKPRKLLAGLFVLLAGILIASPAMAQVTGIPAFSINEGEGGST